ncbi:MAG TPA: hypothetical protein VMA75_02145 [Candidatus Paceibacterota bacterium]|nr:hypothetical protein [Candidatus Paceibacterota bacterium]
MCLDVANSMAAQWYALVELAGLLGREIPTQSVKKHSKGDSCLKRRQRKQKCDGLIEEAVGLYRIAYDLFWNEMKEPSRQRLEELRNVAGRLYNGLAISPDSAWAFGVVNDHFASAMNALSADPVSEPQKVVDGFREIPKAIKVLQWHNDNHLRISFDPRRHKPPTRVVAGLHLRTA